jgi:hypothetical protein
MRLWSIHPGHLDSKGLVALWREGLLARAVLSGKTRGYRHHPQLLRFLSRRDPIGALDCYLSRVLDEAHERGYNFDGSKIKYRKCRHTSMPVEAGQIAYEWEHLLGKLAMRDPLAWRAQRLHRPSVHLCFHIVPGPIASWEKT